MSIIDKLGRKPDDVTETDSGDIIYRYHKTTYRYSVDGVWVKSDFEDSHGLEFRVDEDDSIDAFQWADSCSVLAVAGDEPIYELGRYFIEMICDHTPSGRPQTGDHMTLWLELPGIDVSFTMTDEMLIQMTDNFTGDTYVAQSVEGMMERFEWLLKKEAEFDLLSAIKEEKEKKEAFWAETLGGGKDE